MTVNTTKQLYPQFDSGEDTPESEEHTMTNREWLMSLSDEDFSSNLLCIIVNNEMCSYCENGDTEQCRSFSDSTDDCDRAFAKWLKAEHREVSE